MKKQKAFELLGGTPAAVAAAIGVSPSAVSQWPDPLPSRIADRVLAAVARKYLSPSLLGGDSTSKAEASTARGDALVAGR